MKTTMKIAALGLAIMLAAATALGATIGKAKKNPMVNPVTKHVVYVQMSADRTLCGTYMVELRNQNGQLVAPKQAWIPGKAEYIFIEREDLKEGLSVRIAMFRKSNDSGLSQCSDEWWSEPAVLKGTFEQGKTYRYLLKPVLQHGRE